MTGWSEYTITNAWDAFTVRCGTFERTYENEGEERWQHYDRDRREFFYESGEPVGPQAALAKLWDDLIEGDRRA